MKKLFFYFFMGVYSLMALTIISCSDDDDSISPADVLSNVGVLDAKTGLRLKSISFNYGLYLVINHVAKDKILIENDELPVCWLTKNLIEWSNGEEDNSTGSAKLSFNGSGCLIGFESQYSVNWGKGTWNINLSYNGGYLSKATFYGTYNDGFYSGVYTLNWNDGKLMSMECSLKERFTSNSDYNLDIKTAYKYLYDNNKYHNKYGQFPECIGDDLSYMYDEVYFLHNLGLLGKGPSYLPTGVSEISTEIDSDNEKSEYKYNGSFSYEFNNDGSIKTEYWDREDNDIETITYSYYNKNNQYVKSKMNVQQNPNPTTKKSSHRDIMKKSMERRMKH